jgi:hypothetical protein
MRPGPRAVLASILASAALLVGLSLISPSGAAAGERHAGTVLAVDPSAHTLTVDEFGAGGERRALRVEVPAGAVVLQSVRNPASRGTKDAFVERPVRLGEVGVGDFVVVELSDEPGVARLVMITRRRGAGS